MKVINLFKAYDHYKTIDEMPIYNWLKVQATNDVRWVLHIYRDCPKKQMVILQEAQTKMTNEYIDTFGMSEEYVKILELTRDIRVLELKYMEDGNKVHLTMIEYNQAKLKVLRSRLNKGDAEAVKVHVAKYLGFQVNFKQMTVREFYSALKEIKHENEQQRKANG